MSDYPISVVVPTMRGWPTTRIAIDGLLPQVIAAKAQLVVADGSGHPPPDEIAGAPDVVWLSMPGVTVFDLRQAAYRRADSELIACTEDHCRPADDWVANILRAHAENPGAAMIFGTVENGTSEHLIDWALYCAGYAVLAPPLSLTTKVNPGHANTSWKRWAFQRVPMQGDKVLEFRYSAALRQAGATVMADDRLRVQHFQCDGIRDTSRLFFHNGRAIAGVRRPAMAAADWGRMVAPPLVAGWRTLRTLRAAWSKPTIRIAALRSTPLLAMLHLVHALGESVGYLRGPGDSGTHLH